MKKLAPSLASLLIICLLLPLSGCRKKSEDEDKPGRTQRVWTLYVLMGGEDGLDRDRAEELFYELEDVIEPPDAPTADELAEEAAEAARAAEEEGKDYEPVEIVPPPLKLRTSHLPRIRGNEEAEFYITFRAEDPKIGKAMLTQVLKANLVSEYRYEAGPKPARPEPEEGEGEDEKKITARA